ncbi:VWA domain-containing protein, partial [bacterium]|nr:VWA domain-containing protein [bacterium]
MQGFFEWLSGGRSQGLESLQFGLSFPFGFGWALALLLACGAIASYLYWPQLHRQSKSLRIALVALRTGSVLLILLLLMDPCIIGQRIQPGEQTVVLLFDDSKSMQVHDMDGRSRAELLMQRYAQEKDQFEQALKQRFNLAKYRFGASLDAIGDVSQNRFAQSHSDLAQALSRAQQENQASNIAAVVLFSDGAQNAESALDLADAARQLSAPIFAVGVGEDVEWKDARIRSLSVNRTHFDNSPVSLAVDMETEGLAGETLQVELLEDGRSIDSKSVEIQDAVQANQVRLDFTPQKKDWVEYTVQLSINGQPIQSQPGQEFTSRSAETIVQNNTRSFVIDNRKTEYKILFYSGRPNWQHKFVRRALLEDEQLKTASLILISKAERKFVFRGARTTTTNPLFDGFEQDQDKYGRYDEPIYLRLGVSKDELTSGYPREAKELFGYDLVIWNEADLSDLSLERLELTREFVDKRGGSFLLIGGKTIFNDGKLASSPIEPMLPVLSGQIHGDSVGEQERFQVEATNEGFVSGAWTLDSDKDMNQLKWSEMPALFRYQPFQLTRAGAVVMAQVQAPDVGARQPPFYAVQRYGAGKCAVLSSPETWPWQMKADLDDETHEQLWRQVVRNLVANVPKPIALQSIKSAYPVETPVALSALVRDAQFDAQEGAQTEMTMTAPSGQSYVLGVEESLDEMGVYQSEFTPTEVGMYRLRIEAKAEEENEEAGSRDYAFLVEPDLSEFQNAKYNPATLQEIADQSGGELLSLDQLAEIPAKIPFVNQEETEWVRIHLWHNPLLYCLLVMMLCAEWYL